MPETEEYPTERRIPRRSIIGQGTAVTVSVVGAIGALCFWSGVMWSHVQDLQLQVPAVADAAKSYTDQQINVINVKYDGIILRLDRIEAQLDHMTRRTP